METIRTLITPAIFTLLGFGVAWLGSQNGVSFNGAPVLMICAAVAYGINWLAYIPAAIAKTEKFYDLTGAITNLSLVATALALSGPHDLRAITAALMVAVWASRLGWFLISRIHALGSDRRFDEAKTKPLSFIMAWTMQACWTILMSIGALIAITTAQPKPIDFFFFAGVAIWLTGFFFEVVADHQKKIFREDPANKDKFIQTGLWAWSRHPNYFGEILLSVGITIMVLPILQGGQWIALISPVFMTVLLTKVSGIPLLAQRAKEKFGDDPDYQDYVRRTPPLIPRPPQKAA